MIDALPLIAPQSPEVVAVLVAALEDADGTVQAYAVMSLGKLGAAARPAVAVMANMLSGDKDYCTRGHPVIFRRLSDCVASVLGDLGPVAKEAVPALVKAAGKTRGVNWQAIPALGKIGPEAKAAVPFLLQNSTPEAAIAIAQIDPDNDEIIPILRQTWQSAYSLQPRPEIYPDRSWCYVLGRFGPRVKPAIATLEELLDMPNCRCRMAVALTVLEIDPTHQQALDTCVAALRERSNGFPEVGPITHGDFLDWEVEGRLDRLMVPLGPRARAFVPALLRNPDKSRAKCPHLGSRASGGDRFRGGRSGTLANPSIGLPQSHFSHRRRFAEQGGGGLGTYWGGCGAVVGHGAVKDDDFLIRAGSSDALGRIGPTASPAVPALVEALSDERMIVRASAAMALGRIGQAAAPAVPALARVLRDEYSLVHRNAAESAGRGGASC